MQLPAVDTVVAMFKDSKLVCLVESSQKASSVSRPAIFRGSDLDFDNDLSSIKHYNKDADSNMFSCFNFCVDSTIVGSKVFSAEVNLNRSYFCLCEINCKKICTLLLIYRSKRSFCLECRHY